MFGILYVAQGPCFLSMLRQNFEVFFCLTFSWSQSNPVQCWCFVRLLCPTGEWHGLAECPGPISESPRPSCVGQFPDIRARFFLSQILTKNQFKLAYIQYPFCNYAVSLDSIWNTEISVIKRGIISMKT